ncbi:GGDEF domain-containing protein [Acholeplasma hippikon]|uniref:PAS domain S-box protein n=1 Tax=Acholeplasma hippikon TaxID=264636 RepID=A0A449BKT7_9MOLU|nr:GGDEF domain-containing protein [Acholeplasma hippikon]VEU83078.1 PAS domain S-box protein [Acholeplasma hippikon]
MEVFAQHPVFGVIIAVFIIILVITESILKENLLKNRLTFSFINLTIFVVLLFFYESLILTSEDYLIAYIVYLYLTYGAFLLALYKTFKNAITKGSQYQLFVKGIKNTKWNVYYIVDQKERIKDISTSLLRELNLDKEEVSGKKFMSVFSSKVRFTKMNGDDINDRTLEKYFIDYKKRVSPNESEEMELNFQNFRGDTTILHMNMQPLFVLGKYKGRMCIGEKRTEEELLAVEKELKATDRELESIRHKFIATLELSDEGLFYIDLDEKTIWLNDSVTEQLKLPTNELSLADYRKLIEPQDLQKYLQITSDLTPNKQIYVVSYRLNVNGQQMWVKEKGKRLFEDKKNAVIMGIISPVNTSHFRKSGIEVLDTIKDENHLLPDLKSLIKNGRPFQLAILKLSNIPQINEMHGREVGNMLMAQYIAKVKQSFVTESSDLYRLSGLEFALTITDARKMASLYNGIRAEDNHLNMVMEYGAITAEVETFIGVAQMYDDAVNAQDLYQNAMRALKTAQLPQFKGQGCYYKDIK